MRIFIAINFDEEVKLKLISTQNVLREYALSGNFTRDENLHLTLVFLGEVLQQSVPLLKQIMDSVNITPFSANIVGVGNFPRDNGDIWWTGIDESENLTHLHSQLCKGLLKHGFEIEKRKFTPHLTLARQVQLNKNFNKEDFLQKISAVNFSVNTISLMSSQNIDGKLTYKEVYEKQL